MCLISFTSTIDFGGQAVQWSVIDCRPLHHMCTAFQLFISSPVISVIYFILTATYHTSQVNERSAPVLRTDDFELVFYEFFCSI